MLQTVLEGLPVVLLAAAYMRRARTLARAARPVGVWRQLSFAGGLAVICAAIGTPVASLGEDLQVAHMVQHILLGDIAALLIVLGLTKPLLQPLLGAPALRHLRVLSHPVVALGLWVASLYAWHIPVLYEAAVEHPLVHAAEHASFLGAGIAMWGALLGPLPKPAWFSGPVQLAYVFLMRITGALLANVLIWSQTPFYPSYIATAETHGFDPVTDQNVSGAVLMIEGSLVTITVFAWMFLRWARADEQRQQLLDQAERAGITLDEQRAARAVAAGYADLLAQRLEQQVSQKRRTAGLEKGQESTKQAET